MSVYVSLVIISLSPENIVIQLLPDLQDLDITLLSSCLERQEFIYLNNDALPSSCLSNFVRQITTASYSCSGSQTLAASKSLVIFLKHRLSGSTP